MKQQFLFSFILLGLIMPALMFAATGTIDSTYKYAWSDNVGWINFGCNNCNVQITDSAITGYAWSQNAGWINLAPTNSGVKNSGGTLSGYAWGTSLGWINFAGVTINSSGQFAGQATGTIVGTIAFDNCGANCGVTTSWRSYFCGDGMCNGGENCSTCPADCGTCGISGGGGGSVVCSFNSACGIDGYTGSLFCQNGNVYQNYTTYTCSNPGTTASACSSSAAAQLITTCSAGQICNNGACITPPACSFDSDCGTNGYTADSPFCKSDNNVYQNYNTYTCSNPGAANSACSNNTVAKLKTTCSANDVCDNGSCVLQQHNECNGQQQCIAVDGAGTDQCADNDDCATHHTCNTQNQCVSVNGLGNDQCQIDGDCYTTHNECNNSQCTAVAGIGINQCSSNNDCIIPKHNECNGQQQCIAVDGAGTDQCLSDSDCASPSGIQGGVVGNHTECNGQQQCVSVPGAGSNQCQADNDCSTQQIIKNIVTAPIESAAKAAMEITKAVGNTVQAVAVPIESAVVATGKVINTPQGSVTTKAVSTAGLAVATVATATSFFTFSFVDLFSIPFRMLGLLLAALGIKKRIVPWGVAYDSITKRPLDPAYIVLKNMQGEEVSSATTDLDGRYGFLVQPGIYQMTAHKTNYVFPSQKLAGKIQDELYANLYSGDYIEIKKLGEAITKNIPLDPVKFDWNEFEKKNKNLMKFYSKWDILLRKIYDLFFIVGFIVAFISYIFAPFPYNAIIAILYLVFILLRSLGLKPKTYGYLLDKATGEPLSFAIIRIVMPDTNVQIASKSADQYGRYYCLVPPGKYYVKIEKKNLDGSYSIVYTSEIINVSRKGIIKTKFKV